jgi:hypothetical protein
MWQGLLVTAAAAAAASVAVHIPNPSMTQQTTRMGKMMTMNKLLQDTDRASMPGRGCAEEREGDESEEEASSSSEEDESENDSSDESEDELSDW